MIIYNAFDYLFEYTYLLILVKINIVYMQHIIISDNLQAIWF